MQLDQSSTWREVISVRRYSDRESREMINAIIFFLSLSKLAGVKIMDYTLLHSLLFYPESILILLCWWDMWGINIMHTEQIMIAFGEEQFLHDGKFSAWWKPLLIRETWQKLGEGTVLSCSSLLRKQGSLFVFTFQHKTAKLNPVTSR